MILLGKVNTMSVKSAAGQHTLRERNMALVAQEIFTAPAPISRAAISAHTGLTRATVSALVDLLVDSRIVAELVPAAPKGAGRPAVPLVPASGTFFGVGLEVTVRSLTGVIYDLSGQNLAELKTPRTPGSTPDQVFAGLAQITTDLIDRAIELSNQIPGFSPVIAGVQVALPGLIDPHSATLRVAPNLGWHNLDPVDTSPISAAVLAKTGQAVAVSIGNEAKYGAIAQTIATNLETFIYVSADVGIGSAIVMDGNVFQGRRGWSGELGHVTVDPDGPACSCGSLGCLEQYAGRTAILNAAGQPNFGQFLAALAAGDPVALDTTNAAGRALGAALSDYINLIDIDTIVLGGIYAQLMDYLKPVIIDALKAKVLSAQWSNFQIIPAPVREGASTQGAAHQVLQGVYHAPTEWITVDPEA